MQSSRAFGNLKSRLEKGKTLPLGQRQGRKEEETYRSAGDDRETGDVNCSYSSEQNRFVERRFGTLYKATRAELISSGLQRSFWSVARLNAIDKANCLLTKHKNGSCKAPNATMLGIRYKANSLLPFEQMGYIVDTTPTQRKLDDRALK